MAEVLVTWTEVPGSKIRPSSMMPLGCQWHYSSLHIITHPPPRPQVPMAEVQVTWTEVPGSKIRPSSMVHMALELAAIKAGYGLGLWRVRGEDEPGKEG